MRLGIFGGTFDPPHLGHLILASEAHAQLSLDKVLWVVTGQSPFKLTAPLTDDDLRVGMVRASIDGNEAFELSRVDLERPGPHFTSDTVALIAHQNPGAQLYYVMGADSLRDFPEWHAPTEIISRSYLAVLRRPGTTVDLTALQASVPGIAARVQWIDAPQLDISSRDLRRRVRAGEGIRYFVPDSVCAIIAGHGLYRGESDSRI